MTRLLRRLLGRMPIGWLQLTFNKVRLATAVGGVAFANILIFMQLGFLGALVETIRTPYTHLNADILISAADARGLSDGGALPRERMFQALSVPGVAAATPLYVGRVDWRQPDGTTRAVEIYGVDPASDPFRTPEIAGRMGEVALADRLLIDRGTRNVAPSIFEAIDAGTPATFELQGRTMTVVGTFEMGGGFGADGFAVISDQTFFRLFPQREAGAPDHVLVRVAHDATVPGVVAALQTVLPAYDAQVVDLEAAIARDQSFQTTQRPVGLIFGFGVVIGVIVGIIIVYQVLSTDVADHLREYATFKAMGYRQGFFLGIVFEEALILAVLGFVPGLALSLDLYAAVSSAAGLPVAMDAPRALGVFAGTLAMSLLSGAVATRRLGRVDPAELF